MDNGFGVDPAKVIETVREHDVITMRFVTVGRRLLLDFRTSELDGPLVRMVEPVKSARERFQELAKMRPRFRAPEKIVAIWWPRFVRSLDETGVRDAILTRVAESGHPDAVRAAERTLDEIVADERKYEQQAIVGDGFRTLWSESAPRR
jgi:hypothetical protein